MPIRTCRQCFEEYVANPIVRNDDGFCSDPCEQQYDKEIAADPDIAKLIEQIARNDFKPSNIMVNGVEIGYLGEDDCCG